MTAGKTTNAATEGPATGAATLFAHKREKQVQATRRADDKAYTARECAPRMGDNVTATWLMTPKPTAAMSASN